MEGKRFLSYSEIEMTRRKLQSFLDLDFSKVTFDLDQVMAKTEEPVKEAFFNETGLDYRDRKINKYHALAYWAEGDGLDLEPTVAFERKLWTDEKILFSAPPNPVIQTFSYIATRLLKKVNVITARNSDLKGSTLDWVKQNYSWIDLGNVHIRDEGNNANGGYLFKAETVNRIGPDVHFEDGKADIEHIVKSPDRFPIIYFPRLEERYAFSINPRVITVPTIELLGNLMLKAKFLGPSHNVDTPCPFVVDYT